MVFCDRHYTLCNIHVNAATKLIAITCTLVHLFATLKWAFLYFFTETHYAKNTAQLDIIGYAIGLVIASLFLIGSFWKKPFLYLPFLLYNVLFLLAAPIALISLIVLHVTQLSTQQSTNHFLYENYANGPLLIGFIVSLVLWSIFHGFLLSIVVRDYIWLKEQKEYDYYYQEFRQMSAENERIKLDEV